MDAWSDMGWPARIALVLCLAPLVAAAMYAVRPTTRRLALTRALSLAALAAGVGATVFGIASLLQTIGHRPQLGHDDWSWIAIGFGERLVTSSAALGSLTIAWLLAAVGASRAADGTA